MFCSRQGKSQKHIEMDLCLSLRIPTTFILPSLVLISRPLALSPSLSLPFSPPHSQPFAPLFSLLISPPVPVSLCASRSLSLSRSCSCSRSCSLSLSMKTIMALIAVDYETKSDNIKLLHAELLHIAGSPSVSGRVLKDVSDC